MNRLTASQTNKEGTAPALLAAGILQRKCDCGQHTIAGGECSSCSEERAGTLQRSALNRDLTNGRDGAVPPIVHDVLSSPGQPLDAATRDFFEPRFGHDFSRVRVHSNARAAESARAVNALAYTVGHDVIFGDGRFSPGTSVGKQLLAHELTHVIQQGSRSENPRDIVVGAADAPFEHEAELVASRVLLAPVNQTERQVGQPQVMQRAPVSLLREVGCESRSWPDSCSAPGGCEAGKQCGAMRDWSACACWDTGAAKSRVQETVPGWLLAMLGAAAMLALIACFGTGVCEVGIVIGGLGAAAAAALLFILRGLGLANDGSSGASADLGDAGGAADVGVAST